MGVEKKGNIILPLAERESIAQIHTCLQETASSDLLFDLRYISLLNPNKTQQKLKPQKRFEK